MRMRRNAHATSPDSRSKRIPTNVTLDAALVAEARELGVNISQASARGLEDAVKRARSQQWLEENRSAIEASNAHVEEHGIPLESYRMF